MNLKRFFAKDMRTAIAEIKEQLGPDAIIMSSKKVSGGMEVVAAVDYKVEDAVSNSSVQKDNNVSKRADDKLADDSVKLSSSAKQKSVSYNKSVKNSAAEKKKQEQFADSLAELLARQQKRPVVSSKKVDESPKPLKNTSSFKDYYNTAQQDSISNSYKDDNANKNKVSAVDNEQIIALSKEVESIRKLLQYQLAGLMADTREREEPVRAMVSRLLVSSGFNEELAIKLANKVGNDATFSIAWQELARILINNINIGNDSIMKNGGAIALVGPTGVGKTTTVAKLAARFALKYGSDQVALISTDHYRIGAQEQLQTYGRIMGCVVKQVEDFSELADVLYSLRNKSLVLIDTAGFGQRDNRLEQELMELERNARVKLQNYLVLSATSQRRVLEDSYKRFSKIGIDGLILTKIDESLSLGDAASLCIQNDLPLSYITTGQRVPEDLEPANARSFVLKLLANIEENENSVSEGNENRLETGASWSRDLTQPS